ncbi:hypothetical protein Gasu_25090 isoform 1 [Galdieria sulphuraria]|uniref:Sec20 C-terminal domain-containing protein n=1 Tax=Galdieria sulphuraria TaxID=130081 RepID=M2X187_GALSU|nr:hypothetical protein Gasu_25090 isoform 1 [Galdieria sulphuraria]EME30130.1 hypothetical protein isoform 1 [Galdieria sulphuraria]|eukprot:XP_005706650.1 hypothetical protein isoform 1 [Galdieria sulphuraria]
MQFVNRIETLQTECQQRQEKLKDTGYLVEENEELLQLNLSDLKQLQEAIEQLELFIAEEEDEALRHKWIQLVEAKKEKLQQLQKQHRIDLLRWKQWKEQHQRQLLLEEQRLRRRRPHNTSEEERPDDWNTKIQSSLQNTKQILNSQVLVTNSNLDRIRKDERLLRETQSQQQNYSEHIQQGTQQLRSITKNRQSHWKLILSFVLFLLVCALIVYQRLEHSSWFGVARGTRIMKRTVLVTFQGLYIGLQYLWNLSVHVVYYIWELTQFLWVAWQKEPKWEESLQHTITQNFSRSDIEQWKDEDSEKNHSVVFPTSFISVTLSVDNPWNSLSSADDCSVSEDVVDVMNDESVEHQESVGVSRNDWNETFSNEWQEKEEEIELSKNLDEEQETNAFENMDNYSDITEQQVFTIYQTPNRNEILQVSEWVEDADGLEENNQDANALNLSKETDQFCLNGNIHEEDISLGIEENGVDENIIMEMHESEEFSENYVSQEDVLDENLE